MSNNVYCVTSAILKLMPCRRGHDIPLGIVLEIEVWTYEQMVYAQPRICLGEWDAQTPMIFCDTNESPNLGQTTRPYNNQQKRQNLHNCGLWCPSGP